MRQYRAEGVEFDLGARARRACALPRSLFDSVADNLIRNALVKRAGRPGGADAWSRSTLDGEVALRVTRHRAAPCPEELAARLLRRR